MAAVTYIEDIARIQAKEIIQNPHHYQMELIITSSQGSVTRLVLTSQDPQTLKLMQPNNSFLNRI